MPRRLDTIFVAGRSDCRRICRLDQMCPGRAVPRRRRPAGICVDPSLILYIAARSQGQAVGALIGRAVESDSLAVALVFDRHDVSPGLSRSSHEDRLAGFRPAVEVSGRGVRPSSETRLSGSCPIAPDFPRGLLDWCARHPEHCRSTRCVRWKAARGLQEADVQGLEWRRTPRTAT